MPWVLDKAVAVPANNIPSAIWSCIAMDLKQKGKVVFRYPENYSNIELFKHALKSSASTSKPRER
jgi:hypothetical protein